MIDRIELRKRYREETGEHWKMLSSTAQPTVEYTKWLEDRLVKSSSIPDAVEQSRTRLEKHKVCVDCLSVGIQFNDCRCTYQKNYPAIELDFEVCNCCGNLISDGSPAETEFNEKQLSQNDRT